MHLNSADLIGAVICAIAIIRFWRAILVIVLLTIVCAIILGCAAVLSYIHV
jgi:hypothetical protein